MNLILIALLAVSTPAHVEPDGVVATAPPGRGAAPVAAELAAVDGPTAQTVPHGLSTDQQIDRWLADRPAGETAFADETPDRDIHGELSVGIGTGGYRAYGGAVTLPLGPDGRLELRFRDVDNDPYARSYGYWDERQEAAPYAFGPATAAPRYRRHRGLD